MTTHLIERECDHCGETFQYRLPYDQEIVDVSVDEQGRHWLLYRSPLVYRTRGDIIKEVDRYA